MSRTTQEQFVTFLSDMYSVEQQAISQMAGAPALAGDPALAQAIEQHQAETEQQAVLVGQRLEAHGEKPSVLKDAFMKLGGKGFALMSALMPETPGRLLSHSYAYEAMESAGYHMLGRFAQELGDQETVQVAEQIGAQERRMLERLGQCFGAAEEASHRDTTAEDMPGDLQKHINEAHALETQAISLLSKSKEIAADPALVAACHQNLEAARQHAQVLEQRLEALGSSTSKLKDAALGAGGLNWAFFFQSHSDTPVKLAAFAYANEHLKLAGYELLLRTAKRGADVETQRLCETLIADQKVMAERLAATFDSAVDATLVEVQAK